MNRKRDDYMNRESAQIRVWYGRWLCEVWYDYAVELCGFGLDGWYELAWNEVVWYEVVGVI